jgi:glycosyltransferase involved in cell wall biosynthesis
VVRVIYFLARVRPGGSLTLTRERIRYLLDSPIEPAVVALLPSLDDDAIAAEALAEFSVSNVPVEVVGHSSRAEYLRSARRLGSVVRSRAEILHAVNSPSSHTIAAAMLSRRPLVRDLVSTSTPTPLDRLAAHSATANIALSQAVAVAHSAPRTRVIYPPICPSSRRASEPASDIDISRPTVLVVSRLSVGRGIEHLPAIAEELRRLVADVHVVVAGDGPLRADLKRSLSERRLDDTVSLLGFRKDIAQLHAAADAYLSISAAEGLVGYGTLEAVMARTPVVASDIPAVTEVLRDGQDGWFVDPVNHLGVAAAVADALFDPERARERSASALSRVTERLDPRNAVAQLVELYKAVAN